MQENVYAIPESNIDTLQIPVRQMFYVVSKTKFLVLFFCTFGLFSIYWHFKNWKLYKSYHNENMMPVMRAIFSVFFTHALFSVVDMRIKDLNKEFVWNHSLYATLVVTVVILSNILDRVSSYSSYEWISILVLPLLILHGWLLAKAQAAINICCEDPLGISNNQFTWLNWIWILLGGLFVLTVIFGVVLIVLELQGIKLA